MVAICTRHEFQPMGHCISCREKKAEIAILFYTDDSARNVITICEECAKDLQLKLNDMMEAK